MQDDLSGFYTCAFFDGCAMRVGHPAGGITLTVAGSKARGVKKAEEVWFCHDYNAVPISGGVLGIYDSSALMRGIWGHMPTLQKSGSSWWACSLVTGLRP